MVRRGSGVGTGARLALTLTLVVPLAIYGAWALRFLHAGVGYEMDEALYVESAVHLLRGGETPPPFVHDSASWVRVAGRPWPLMIIPYVGATKAYVALPLFAVFGVGPEVARLTGVALAGLGLVGLSTLIAATAGLLPAFLTGMLLAIHPSYLDLTVFDNGGTAVWMGAMGLLALALTHHRRRGSVASAFLLGLAAGLAVWARLNLLWLLAAAAVAAGIVFGRRILPRGRTLGALAAGGLLGSSPLLWYEIVSRLGTLAYMRSARQPLTPALVGARLRGVAEVLVADREQRTIWGGPPVEPWQLLLGAALLLLLVLAPFLPGRSSGEGVADRAAWRRWLAWTALLLLPILAASRLNVTQHHLAAVLPLALAALAIASVELADRFRRVRALAPVLAIGAAGLSAVFIGWDMRIARGLRETGGLRAFSSALDDAARVLAARRIPPDRLKIVNWGFQNNLYVVTGGAVWGTELFWGATRGRTQQGRSWDDEVRDGGAFLLFAFPMGPPWIGDGAFGFEDALARSGGPRTETVFRERSGAPCVRLIEVRGRDAPPTRPSASP
ncbi:MAG TPA: hypothetical protein VGO79_07280 [Thermoanaerobaculia bacterium]